MSRFSSDQFRSMGQQKIDHHNYARFDQQIFSTRFNITAQMMQEHVWNGGVYFVYIVRFLLTFMLDYFMLSFSTSFQSGWYQFLLRLLLLIRSLFVLTNIIKSLSSFFPTSFLTDFHPSDLQPERDMPLIQDVKSKEAALTAL